MRRKMQGCRDHHFIRRIFHDHRQQHHRVDNLFRRISRHFLHQGRTGARIGPRDSVGIEFGQRRDVVLVDFFAVEHEAVPQHVEQGIILERSPLAAVQIKPHFLRRSGRPFARRRAVLRAALARRFRPPEARDEAVGEERAEILYREVWRQRRRLARDLPGRQHFAQSRPEIIRSQRLLAPCGRVHRAGRGENLGRYFCPLRVAQLLVQQQ